MQLFFLATISTVTVVSNWSFRSFRNRLNQHEYPHPHPPSFSRQNSAQYAPIASSQGQYQNGHNYGYLDHQEQKLAPAPNLDEKQNGPMLLEHPRMNCVTGRNRDREIQLRSPSPVKRRNLL